MTASVARGLVMQRDPKVADSLALKVRTAATRGAPIGLSSMEELSVGWAERSRSNGDI